MQIWVEYAGWDDRLDERLRSLTSVVDDGSGFGFGKRDISWTFRNKAAGELFAKKAKATLGARKGAKVRILKNCD